MNLKEEEQNRGFSCINCRKWVPVRKHDNTVNRNHCPHCLWSKHVDKTVAGDRLASCNSGMKPIGLTIKTPRVDKWGVEVKGEIMIVHKCVACGKISINRILSQDLPEEIMSAFEASKNMNLEQKEKLKKDEIIVLEEQDREEVKKQIFGN